VSSSLQPAEFERIRRQLYAARESFSRDSAVFSDVSQRLMERLKLLAIEPDAVLDLGCRHGYQFDNLRAQFPRASLQGIDPAGPPEPQKRRWWPLGRQSPGIISADPHNLPFADESFDLVVSNLLLPWCHDPALIFREVVRILRPDGAFMFTSAGPDTLQEYAQVWAEVDRAQHLFGLADMHTIGDELLAAGLSAPVLDRENIIIDYPSIDALQDELRELGAGNVASGRRAGLMAGSVRNKLRRKSGDGRFAVTLELVHGHGWKGALSAGRNNSGDDFTVSVESLRQSLRSSK